MLSHVVKTLRTVARQAPLSMGFSRQDYWSELPFPYPEDLPDAGMEPESPALQQILYQSHLRRLVIRLSSSHKELDTPVKAQYRQFGSHVEKEGLVCSLKSSNFAVIPA